MTLALQQQNAEAKILSGRHGVEALLVSTRWCSGAAKPEVIRRELERLTQLSDTIASTLTAAPSELAATILEHARAVISVLSKAERVDSVIVPTFDQDVRDRMMRELQK